MDDETKNIYDPYAGLESTYQKGYTQEAADLGKAQQEKSFKALKGVFPQSAVGSFWNYTSDLITSSRYDRDPEFKAEDYTELYDGVSVEFQDEIGSARNYDHALELRTKYRQLTDDVASYEELGALDQLGFMSLVLAPEIIVSSFATGGFGALAAASKFDKVAKIGGIVNNLNKSYAGRILVNAIPEASFEGIKQIGSPQERTEMDALLTIGLGSVLGGVFKPFKYYDEESGQIVKNLVVDAATNNKQPGKIGQFTRKILEKSQINLQSKMINSPSPTIRYIANKMFHNVGLDAETSAFKEAEKIAFAENRLDNIHSHVFNELLKEYSDSSFIGLRLGRRDIQEEFSELITKRIHGIEDDIVRNTPEEFLDRLDEAIMNYNKLVYEGMDDLGVKAVKEGWFEFDPWYAPVSWNNALIKHYLQAGEISKKDMIKLIKESMAQEMRNLGVDDINFKNLDKKAKNFFEKITQDPLNIGDDDFIIREKAYKDVFEEIKDMYGLSDEQLLKVEESLKLRKTSSAKPMNKNFRRRTPLDTSVTITTKDGQEFAMSNFLELNHLKLTKDYNRRVARDISLRNMGFESRQDIVKARHQVIKELGGRDGNDKTVPREMKKHLVRFDDMIGELLGMSHKNDPENGWWKAIRSLNNFITSSKLGGTWFALSAEQARVAHKVGVTNLMKSPAYAQALKALKDGHVSDRVLTEIMMIDGLGGEIGQVASISRYDEFHTLGKSAGGRFSGALNKTENFSETLAEATMLAGGVKSGTAMLEFKFAVGARANMLDFARKGMNKKAYDYFAEFGFDKETADLIAGEMNKFASTEDLLLNLKSWEPSLMNTWSLGVRRMSNQVVQRALYGDQLAFTLGNKLVGDTMFGSMSMNLMGYTITAHNKQLTKNIMQLTQGGKHAQDVLGNWIFQASAVSTAYIAKTYLNNLNDDKKRRELLSFENIAKNTFNMSTFGAFIPQAVDFLGTTLGNEPIFNSYNKGGVPLKPAAYSYLKDLYTGGKAITHSLSPWGESRPSEWRALFRTAPLSTAPGVRMVTDELADFLGTSARTGGTW